MFERFTDEARRAVVLAQEEAGGLGHDYIGTEHLLIGLAADGNGIASAALSELGATAPVIRAAVERTVGRGRSTSTGHQRPFTPRAKKVMELALREGLQLSDSYIGTEHLLLGLVREGQGVAMETLTRLGVAADPLRSTILRLRKEEALAPTVGQVPTSDPGEEGRLDRIEATLQQILERQEILVRLIRRLESRLPPPPAE